MYRYKKIVAVVVMVVMAGVFFPAIGQAAGNAQMKDWCQKMANSVAKTMARTGGTYSREVIAATGADLAKAGGKIALTNTELLWNVPGKGNRTVWIKIYPAIRRVHTKIYGPGLEETASAKY